VWAPLYVVLDWVLAPGRHPVPWARLWTIVLFPLAWVVYTLVRGPIVGWYPYPFLDPAQEAGYGGVAVYVIAIAAFILLVGAGIVALSRTPWPHEIAPVPEREPERAERAEPAEPLDRADPADPAGRVTTR
jgi:hypothetical protein